MIDRWEQWHSASVAEPNFLALMGSILIGWNLDSRSDTVANSLPVLRNPIVGLPTNYASAEAAVADGWIIDHRHTHRNRGG